MQQHDALLGATQLIFQVPPAGIVLARRGEAHVVVDDHVVPSRAPSFAKMSHACGYASTSSNRQSRNLIMAGGMLLTVPMVMVYFFGQRFLYEGANTLGQIRV